MFENEFKTFIINIIFGYLLGSCLFCQWLPSTICKKNIKLESDDGNPGAANVFKICGWRLGLICVILDISKGFLPVFIGINMVGINSCLFTLLMLAPVCGHAWPAFSHFQGGKCIATIFGELIALLWVSPAALILAALYIFFSSAVKITPHSKRSIFVFSIFALLSFGYEIFAGRYFLGLGCLSVSVIAIIRHIPTLRKETAEEMSKENQTC